MMKRVIILFLLVSIAYPQVLLKLKVQSKEEVVEIVLPSVLFDKGRKITIDNQKIDLGVLKEKGTIIIEVDGEEKKVSFKPYKLKVLDPEGKYGRFKLTVEGEDAVSINLPLWLLKGFFWIAKPFMEIEKTTVIKEHKGVEVRYEEPDEKAIEAAKIVMDFISQPHKFIGGYAGPIHFLHVEEKNEVVDIILQ